MDKEIWWIKSYRSCWIKRKVRERRMGKNGINESRLIKSWRCWVRKIKNRWELIRKKLSKQRIKRLRWL
jgi:hypothetical protein